MDYQFEFDRQVENLIIKKYPDFASLSIDDFKKNLEPLRKHLTDIPAVKVDIDAGLLPFVIVISPGLIPVKAQMTAVEWNNKPGFEKLYPHQAQEFKPINNLRLPTTKAYLLVNINRGGEFLNIRPEDALKTIQSRNQTPLTIEEGVALVTQFPEFLIKNNCFSCLGSRIEGNQRVPAIWINGSKQANLGWCWDRNPHTWLGSAFAAKRLS